MTRFCVFEGTVPEIGRLEKLKRKLRGCPNDPIAVEIFRNDLIGVARLIETGNYDINDPILADKWVNSHSRVWRTPLEFAVDQGEHPETVIYLLEKGARITPIALKLAINGALKDWVSAREKVEFDRAESIIEILSAAGADWSQAFFEPSGRRQEKYTPLDVIAKLGAARAQQIGITSDCTPKALTRTFTGVADFVDQQKAQSQAAALDQGAPPASGANTPGNRRF